MKIVIPDDYEREPSRTRANLRALRSLGEVAHFTERPRDNEEMAEAHRRCGNHIDHAFSDGFQKHRPTRCRACKLRFISIWGTRPRVVDMKRARERGDFRRRDARSGEPLGRRAHDDDGTRPGEATPVSGSRHAGGRVGAGAGRGASRQDTLGRRFRAHREQGRAHGAGFRDGRARLVEEHDATSAQPKPERARHRLLSACLLIS